MLSIVIKSILVFLLIFSAFTDMRERKIPNIITLPAIAVGIILNFMDIGFNGLIYSFSGMVFGLTVFIIPFSLGMLGAGDVKLMAAIGALMGWKFAVLSTLFSAIAGLFVVVGYLIYKKKFIEYLKVILAFFLKPIINYLSIKIGVDFHKNMKISSYNLKVENSEELYVPYGIAIALGTIFVLGCQISGQVYIFQMI